MTKIVAKVVYDVPRKSLLFYLTTQGYADPYVTQMDQKQKCYTM